MRNLYINDREIIFLLVWSQQTQPHMNNIYIYFSIIGLRGRNEKKKKNKVSNANDSMIQQPAAFSSDSK